jgi:tRNA threonylcarbamoyladenosine biosynthesis protein TsaB
MIAWPATPPVRRRTYKLGAMTRLLAFDTSTEAMSIALSLPDRTLAFEGVGGMLASQRLIPGILSLLAQGQVSLAQLDAIAFGSGPGAFTGLRTACSVAQGLALGSGKPVLALDSLMLVAQDALESTQAADGFDLWVAMDARMDEVYAARYRWSSTAMAQGSWHTLAAPAVYSLGALHERWHAQPPECIAGSAIDAFGERLQTGAAKLVPATRSRAAALAPLARAAWARGEVVDAALALPVYLRDKVAQTTAEREAARAAAPSVPA